MTNDANCFTGSIPDHYEHGLAPAMFADFAEDMAGRVAAYRPLAVLEIAAGTGLVTRHLRDLLPVESTLLATDLNPPMLEVAKTKFREDESVDFAQMDGTLLDLPDESFDAVFCQFGIMFFRDRPKGMREAWRVLRPGGRYWFSVWDAHRHNPFARIAHETIGGFFPGNPPTFYLLPYGYASIDVIKDALLEAGFGDITANVLRHNRIFDPDALAQGMLYGNPVIEQIRTRGGVDPDEVVSAMAAAFRRELGASPCASTMQTITIGCRRV
jgi:SAM-dependent methyltransferase